jgi:hypothetical protein
LIAEKKRAAAEYVQREPDQVKAGVVRQLVWLWSVRDE